MIYYLFDSEHILQNYFLSTFFFKQ